MNPGTVLFIVLGFIGLLIYISKALKPSSLENFSVIDETSISNKGKDGLNKLQEGNMSLESLIGAFSTPVVNIRNSTGFGGGSVPSLSDFAKINTPVPTPNLSSAQVDKINIAPANLQSMPQAPAAAVAAAETAATASVAEAAKPAISSSANKAPALPQLTPASFINMQKPQPLVLGQPAEIQEPMTVSDTQGTLLAKSPLPFEEQKSKQIEQQDKRKKRKTKIVYMDKECPKLPDMSLYIRKDSIPCWGCNLK